MSTIQAVGRRDAAVRGALVACLVAFVMLSAGDVLSTWYSLGHGGGREVNGLIVALLRHSGIGAFAVVKATTSAAEAGLFLLGYLLLPGRWRWLVIAAIGAADAWLFLLVGHNLLLILLTPRLFL